LDCEVCPDRLQDKHLDGDVWVDVIIAHETYHSASGQLLEMCSTRAGGVRLFTCVFRYC